MIEVKNQQKCMSFRDDRGNEIIVYHNTVLTVAYKGSGGDRIVATGRVVQMDDQYMLLDCSKPFQAQGLTIVPLMTVSEMKKEVELSHKTEKEWWETN